MQPGAAQTRTWKVTIPNNLTFGSYFLGAIADPTNAVKNDANRNNNFNLGNQINVAGP